MLWVADAMDSAVAVTAHLGLSFLLLSFSSAEAAAAAVLIMTVAAAADYYSIITA